MVRQSKCALLIICEGKRTPAWLRYQSDVQDGHTPIHGRNPYVTTDGIVKRLTGFQDQHFEYIPFDKEYNIQGDLLICFQKDLTIKITNTGKNTLIVPPESITKTLFTNGDQQHTGSRTVLKPGESVKLTFAVSDNETKTAEFSFNYGNYHPMPG